MHRTHAFHQTVLHIRGANDFIGSKEMAGNSHQSVFGPLLEPVDCTAADETGEPHGSGTELFSNLSLKIEMNITLSPYRIKLKLFNKFEYIADEFSSSFY